MYVIYKNVLSIIAAYMEVNSGNIIIFWTEPVPIFLVVLGTVSWT